MKLLIVIDMQNDFIDGSLGTKEAVAIVPNVAKKIEKARGAGEIVVFTRDTHQKTTLKLKKEKIFRFCTALKELTAGRFLASLKWGTAAFLTSLRLAQWNSLTMPQAWTDWKKSSLSAFAPESAS